MGTDGGASHDRFALPTLVDYQNILLRNVGKLAKVGFFIWDELENRPIYVSEEVARIYGLTAEEFLFHYSSQERIAADMIGDDRQRYLDTRASSRAMAAPYTIDFAIRAKDGTLRYGREVGEYEKDAHGRVARKVGALIDLTDQKKAEISLRDQEKRVREVLEESERLMKAKDKRAHELASLVSLGEALTKSLSAASLIRIAVTRCARYSLRK
jgi:PAS domain S-box-containing protein